MGKLIDLTGQRFGTLTVIERDHNKWKDEQAHWICKCDCGKTTVVLGGNLRRGISKTCGANIHKKGQNMRDLTGQRFGRLTVIERGKTGKPGIVNWLCKCDCGNYKEINAYSLHAGLTQSCGCYRDEQISSAVSTHGMSKTRIYSIWAGMKARCYKPYAEEYKNYGGRGIRVCDEWLNNPEAFIQWSLSHGYRDDLSIDRIDSDGNYEPDNCRWADWYEQGANKRNNRHITYNGETHIIAEWARKTGIKASTINGRITVLGWSVEDALTKPVKGK